MAGRSGTNKSAALGCIADMVEDIRPASTFDSGTIDGLMRSLNKNKRSVLSVNDEFANFIENLDCGSTGNGEKSRILTLYNGSNWSKKTKTSGCFNIEDPRFNLVGFTQPHFLMQFAQNHQNLNDGFFQRFLVSVLAEVYVKRSESKKALETKDDIMEMKAVFKSIFENCREDICIALSKEAEEAYNNYHDSVVEFRMHDKFDNHKVSIMSKAKGLSLRLAGVICLLRISVSDIEAQSYNVTVDDYHMALEILSCCCKNWMNAKMSPLPTKKQKLNDCQFQNRVT